MADQQSTKPAIPLGLCQCGCGQRTTIARKTSTRQQHIKGQPTRYINSHSGRVYTPRPVADRIAARTNKTASCWLWTGTANGGYGTLGVQGRTRLVHRVVYELTYGPIPQGLCVLHRCDVPSCINPAHLFLGTLLDNYRDMVQKGRRAPVHGVHNGYSKLAESDVIAIRAAQGKHRDIAAKFGVSATTVSLIKSGRLWSHTGEPCAR